MESATGSIGIAETINSLATIILTLATMAASLIALYQKWRRGDLEGERAVAEAAYIVEAWANRENRKESPTPVVPSATKTEKAFELLKSAGMEPEVVVKKYGGKLEKFLGKAADKIF